MNNTIIATFTGLGLLISSSHAYSQNKYQNFSFVGGALTFGESTFTTEGAKVSATPYLFHNSAYGFIDGTLANYSVLPWVGVTGHYRVAEVSDDFNDIPDGIDDRDGNAEVGLTFGSVGARITYLHDVSSEHNGYEVQLHLGRAFDTPINALTVAPFIQVNYRNSKLSQHLYRISANESNASRLPQFNADSTWVYEAGVIALYDISTRWLGISKLEIDHHDSRSPLIQNDIGWKFGIGMVYQF